MTYIKKPYAGMSSSDYYAQQIRGKIFDIRDAGCYVDGSHDDTANFQATINEAATNAITTGSGGGTVIVPDTGQPCIIGGALQTNVGGINYKSQLYVPQKNFNDQGRVNIKIKGETRPNFLQSAGIGNAITPNTGARILSTLVSSTPYSYVIASIGAATNFESFNYNQCDIEDLQIQLTPDSSNRLTLGGIGFNNAANAIIRNVSVFPFNINLVNSGIPQNNCIGIAMPKADCEHISIIDGCNVGGFESGFLLGEHTSLKDTVADCCLYGYNLGTNDHATHLVRIATYWCANDIFVSGQCHFMIDHLQAEWASQSKWYDDIYTILDPSSYGNGLIWYSIVQADVGWNNTKFRKSGGTGITSVGF